MPTTTPSPSSRTQQWARVNRNSLDDISTSHKRLPRFYRPPPRGASLHFRPGRPRPADPAAARPAKAKKAPGRRPGARGRRAPDQVLRPPMIETSGMNSAITIVPTTTARKMISSGSMIDVIAATALSTSSS